MALPVFRLNGSGIVVVVASSWETCRRIKGYDEIEQFNIQLLAHQLRSSKRLAACGKFGSEVLNDEW